MSEEHPPQLPRGDFSVLSTLSQSFSFHASPESFISARISSAGAQKLINQSDDKEAGHSKPSIVRARILGRHVAVITSHRFCEAVLQLSGGDGGNSNTIRAAKPGESLSPESFVAKAAYRELMADFFPPPNILLLDSDVHRAKKQAWNKQLESFPTNIAPMAVDIAKDHFQSWTEGRAIDLYESMKDLSWRLLLGIFLQLCPGDKDYQLIESLQETLLRGQFSLFPVAVRAPLWKSPRYKAVEARKKLQGLLMEKISSQADDCPFLKQGRIENNEVASHALLFTSSIAVKALSSLLTASLLNLFLLPSGVPPAEDIRKQDPETGQILLESVLLETERLSPPVVGVMRRAQQDVIFKNGGDEPDTLIPAGWDVWLYFVGAGRDTAAYPLAGKFLPERFITKGETNHGFAFGSGLKCCLGSPIIRKLVHVVASVLIKSELKLEGSVEAKGVRGWLGWEANTSAEAFARDLKQLPCQRPKDPILLRVEHKSI